MGYDVDKFQDGSASQEFSFDSLKNMYRENQSKFAAGSRITSTDSRVGSLHQLMTDFSEMTILTNSEAHVEWYESYINANSSVH